LIRATFKTNIIPIGQAELLVRQYAEAFQCILDHPEDHATGLHIAPQELLSHMAPDYPLLDSPVQLLHEFVELQASRQPEKTAFEFFQRDRYGNLVSRTWTYRELDAEGNCVARYLRNRGVKERSYIGICFNKCPEASFAILGILKAGCAYVAIDPTAPPARKNFIAKDSGMVIILSHDQSAGHFENVESPVPILYMDEIDRKLLWPTPATTPVALYPNDICYCLYTSGTTGTPKGCEITHENAVQAMRAFSILFSGRWNDDSKWLQFASFHFDVSVLEQYWSWSEGIVVVSAPRDLIFEDLELTIRSMGITHIDLTPSLASLVHPENVPDLCKGVFITGGEQLKQEILDVWGEHEVIHNGYGPTETTIGVTMYTQVPRSGKPANIGKQFANVGTYVLHPGTNHRVLRGGVGELCISGCLVGKGYLNRADLTADKFPFVQAFGERIYRTGDLVRLCHDDTFLFLGRIDDQVKLRGQRLEIGEINSTIRRAVAAISDVATYVLRHPKQQNDQLVTFFVADALASAKDVNIVVPSHHISHVVAEARAACLERLPGYMVPTFIIPVTRMPLSTNNKTDAKVLKQLFDETSPEQLQNQTAVDKDSLDDAEERIAEILSAFSGVPLASINPRSSIFELGLDSVSVLGFCNKLRLAGYGELSVKHVMSRAYYFN
jgi:amino acid adenylation domain-containing protein